MIDETRINVDTLYISINVNGAIEIQYVRYVLVKTLVHELISL